MGALFSRFRKKPTTKDQLDGIEKDIRNIHEFRINTQQKQKRFIGALMAYSVTIYFVAAAIFYFLYFPEDTANRILYSTPLVLFPVIILVLRRLAVWFFERKLRKNEETLTELLRTKRKIIEDVKETETYKVAREILEKYDPNQLQKIQPDGKPEVTASTSSPELRRRSLSGFPQSQSQKTTQAMPLNRQPVGYAKAQGFVGQRTPSPGASQRFQGPPPGPPKPRGVLPRERTAFDRIIEYLVGDGPNTRYALICRQCQSHNGMAMKEEFEYIAFRCCYCYYWNPPRKQRPLAPRLPDQMPAKWSSLDNLSTKGPANTSTITPNLSTAETKSDEETEDDDEKCLVEDDETKEATPTPEAPADSVVPLATTSSSEPTEPAKSTEDPIGARSEGDGSTLVADANVAE